jgi:hypothetical protein
MLLGEPAILRRQLDARELPLPNELMHGLDRLGTGCDYIVHPDSSFFDLFATLRSNLYGLIRFCTGLLNPVLHRLLQIPHI